MLHTSTNPAENQSAAPASPLSDAAANAPLPGAREYSAAFVPAGVQFHPISGALATVRLVGAGIGVGIFLAAALVGAVLWTKWLWLAVGVFVALLGWLMWLIPRQVKAFHWGISETELFIRKGVMFRSMTVIPFGRLQYVEVDEGPLARPFGIASVELHTASVETDSKIPGLPAAQAAQLRDQLTELGEAHLQGL